MAEVAETRDDKISKSLLHNNGMAEQAAAAPDSEKMRMQTLKQGHSGILTMDQDGKMEAVTTVKAAYVPPKGPGVRLQGIRGELLKKHIAQMISDQMYAEQNAPTPKTEFCSTTQEDFCARGFVPVTPKTTQVHDYKSDQAVTFWSENYQRIQGVTAIQTLKAPFRKSAGFSKPNSERLDEAEFPPDY